MKTIDYILSDFKRVSGLDNAYIRALKNGIWGNNRGYKFLFWFRLSQSKSFLNFFARHIYKHFSNKYCIDIPLSVQCGYGLYLGHGMCIVINGSTIIGNNVNLSQFLNIGSNDNSYAKIEDNVYIAPHVSIVGGLTIGANSSIGAGTVVIKDVPQNATAVGVPARIVHYNNPGRYINNKYHVE